MTTTTTTAVTTVRTTVEHFYNALKNANRFRSNDPGVPVLYGVRLYTLRGNLVLEATNRYVAAQVLIERDYDGDDVDMLLHGDAVRFILRQFNRKTERAGTLTITQEDNTNVAWLEQEQPGMRKAFEVLTLDMEFPQIDTLIMDTRKDTTKGSAQHATIDPRHFWAVAGVVDYRDPPNAGLSVAFVQPGDWHKPVFFGHGADEQLWLQGIIMPVRTVNDSAPAMF